MGRRENEKMREKFSVSLKSWLDPEWEILISQIVISKPEERGGTQKLPYAFTEQGLAMLSGVLNSDKATQRSLLD